MPAPCPCGAVRVAPSTTAHRDTPSAPATPSPSTSASCRACHHARTPLSPTGSGGVTIGRRSERERVRPAALPLDLEPLDLVRPVLGQRDLVPPVQESLLDGLIDLEAAGAALRQ